jgi:sugar lactone lactonase YvrE
MVATPEITCVVDSKSRTGEGAVWDVAEQALYWVDIPQGHLYRFDPVTGENRAFEIGEPIGCFALRERGGAVLATKTGFWLYDFATGRKTAIADPEADKPANRFNDGATDSRGRFWAGTMKEGQPPGRAGAFYRLDPDLKVSKWWDQIWTTNGLTFSPDGRTMYSADTNIDVQTIWSCDYDPDSGTPGERRVFFDAREVEGRPDGGTVDADGCYWMAGVGGWQLVRITPRGKVDRIVDLPVERPSKPMFGGKDLATLYVTTIGSNVSPGTEARQPQAGGLFAVTGLGVKGVPQVRFSG